MTAKTKTPGRMSHSMDEASSLAMRAFLMRVLDGDFKKDAAAMGKAIGFSRAAIVNTRDGKVNGGMRLAKALADYKCVSLDTVIGRVVPTATPAPAPAGA